MVSDTGAAPPSGRNPLEELDSHIPTSFYWYLAVLACVGGFLFGYDTSNIGSALDFIRYPLSSFWTGYLVAGASLGAAVGALVAGPLTDRFGRKSLLITDAAIYAVGAILSAFTVNAFMLLASRTLIGLAIGADSAIATAYIAEFAPRNRRGQLSTASSQPTIPISPAAWRNCPRWLTPITTAARSSAKPRCSSSPSSTVQAGRRFRLSSIDSVCLRSPVTRWPTRRPGPAARPSSRYSRAGAGANGAGWSAPNGHTRSTSCSHFSCGITQSGPGGAPAPFPPSRSRSAVSAAADVRRTGS